MKLYSLPLSPYSARVRGAIYAKNLSIEIVRPPEDWRTSQTFRALNPAMRVPVLLMDDGTALPESAVIVDYLEDAFPQVPLRPRDPKHAAQIRLISTITDLYVMQTVFPIFMQLDRPAPDHAQVEAAFAKLDAGLSHLDSVLRAGSYAHGDQLSTADIWLTPVRFTLDGLMGFAKRPDLLDAHPAIAAYTDVAKRDPVLRRVWQEMSDGLAAFMGQRQAEGKGATI